MARFYSNENFPLQVMRALREFGHDVVTIQERGNGNRAISDEDVLAFAFEEQRVVITLNRGDFIRFHRTQPNHFGIVVCTVDKDFQGRAERINQQIRSIATLAGQLVRINRPSR